MDLRWIAPVAVGLVAVWLLLLAVFWLLRPRDVPVREVVERDDGAESLVQVVDEEGHPRRSIPASPAAATAGWSRCAAR